MSATAQASRQEIDEGILTTNSPGLLVETDAEAIKFLIRCRRNGDLVASARLVHSIGQVLPHVGTGG